MSRKITHIDLFVAAVKSLGIGLGLALKHFFRSIGVKRRTQVGAMDASYFHQPDGIVTNLYPYESIPVPDNGRYRLHNEVDDCIVCDLCAKVCPVNCIDIEPIKSPVEISKTSDGSTKRIFAAKFDIDMAKCCYCGLCTTVCPTECLTMTKTYDFSEYDVNNMVYHFAEMSPSEAVIKKEAMEVLAAEEKAKKAATATPKATTSTESNETATETTTVPKPAFKPKVTIPAKKPTDTTPVEQTEIPSSTPVAENTSEATQAPAAPKPVFKPKVMIPAKKPVTDQSSEQDKSTEALSSDTPSTEASSDAEPTEAVPKPVYRPKPVMKPVTPKKTEGDVPAASASNEASEEAPKPAAPKPVIKPVMKPVIPKKKENEEGGENA